jgi:hypothetical protein
VHVVSLGHTSEVAWHWAQQSQQEGSFECQALERHHARILQKYMNASETMNYYKYQ